jgi:hypothetical protein
MYAQIDLASPHSHLSMAPPPLPPTLPENLDDVSCPSRLLATSRAAPYAPTAASLWRGLGSSLLVPYWPAELQARAGSLSDAAVLQGTWSPGARPEKGCGRADWSSGASNSTSAGGGRLHWIFWGSGEHFGRGLGACGVPARPQQPLLSHTTPVTR